METGSTVPAVLKDVGKGKPAIEDEAEAKEIVNEIIDRPTIVEALMPQRRGDF